jgi:DNA-binding NarL/FixJ family response regulator
LGPIRVLVVDDFEPWRRAVCSILGKDSDLVVVGECSDGTDAVRKCGELQPDLVLLDIQLPGMNGFVAAQQISQICPQTKVLFLSAQRSFDVVREALRIGGGMIAKTDAHRDLAPMIKSIVRGEAFVRFEVLKDSVGDSGKD